MELNNIELSAIAVRLIIELRRLLRKEYAIEINITHNNALVQLLDATCMTKNSCAKALACSLCDELLQNKVAEKKVKYYRNRVKYAF